MDTVYHVEMRARKARWRLEEGVSAGNEHE